MRISVSIALAQTQPSAVWPPDRGSASIERNVTDVTGGVQQRAALATWIDDPPLEHDPEKHVLDPDRGWTPVFGKDHAPPIA